jgi:hypothetical protein
VLIVLRAPQRGGLEGRACNVPTHAKLCTEAAVPVVHADCRFLVEFRVRAGLPTVGVPQEEAILLTSTQDYSTLTFRVKQDGNRFARIADPMISD